MSQPLDCPLDHALVRTVLVVEDEALIRISICEDLRLDMLALLLEQAKDEAESRMAERRKRSPPATQN